MPAAPAAKINSPSNRGPPVERTEIAPATNPKVNPARVGQFLAMPLFLAKPPPPACAGRPFSVGVTSGWSCMVPPRQRSNSPAIVQRLCSHLHAENLQ